MVNAFLTWWGRYWNITDPELTLELMLGYLLFPVAWLLGVPGPDVYRVAQLIGMKVIANEYVTFKALTTQDVYTRMGARSRLIATYAYCVSHHASHFFRCYTLYLLTSFSSQSFGNIGSLGTQIGVLSQMHLDVPVTCPRLPCPRCSLGFWQPSPRPVWLAYRTPMAWEVHDHHVY